MPNGRQTAPPDGVSRPSYPRNPVSDRPIILNPSTPLVLLVVIPLISSPAASTSEGPVFNFTIDPYQFSDKTLLFEDST